MPKMSKLPKMPKIMVSLAQRRRLRRVSLRHFYNYKNDSPPQAD